MGLEIIKSIDVPAIGGVDVIDVTQLPLAGVIILYSSSPSLVMLGNYSLSLSGTPQAGTTIQVYWNFQSIDTGIASFQIFGDSYQTITTQNPLAIHGGGFIYSIDALGLETKSHNFPFEGVTISGGVLTPKSVELTKLELIAHNKVIMGDGSNEATTDYIKNANIDASADIARTKIASGTPDQVVVNASHTGALDSVAQLPPALGGTGLSTSSSTGFPVISSGTWSAGALTETIRVDVSFATASQGTYYVALPACTVTKVKARVTSAIAGTDDATITCQNATSTNMTNGLITLPASSAHGTGVSVTPSANNTLSAGAEMQLVVAKVTQGGTASVDITFTRTALI
jgi:hypothetical protein